VQLLSHSVFEDTHLINHLYDRVREVVYSVPDLIHQSTGH
jgi:hypothetical protein